MATFLYPDSEIQMDTSFILCIEELDPDNSRFPIDTRLFIGWNDTLDCYFVRGKRQDTRRSQFVPFAFNCESSRDLYKIIKFIVADNKINVTLYNFNNTFGTTIMDDLTYEFFEQQMDSNYEIAGYDNICCTRSYIVNCLRMLQNSYALDNDGCV